MSTVARYWDESYPPFLYTPFTTTAIAPTTSLQSAGSVTISVTGTGFVEQSVVCVDGEPVPTVYVSPTQIRGTVNTQTLSIGPHSVTVQNGYISGDVPQTFTITAGEEEPMSSPEPEPQPQPEPQPEPEPQPDEPTV